MHDQADQLRKLVSAAGTRSTRATGVGPQIIVVAGAKRGVGATTIAVNLAIALVREGRRTLLIDADLDHPEIGLTCGAREGATLADVLSGRRTPHEAMQLGPGGIQLLPGASTVNVASDCSPRRLERWIRDLHSLAEHTDVVLLDVGAASDPLARRLWQAADEVCLVTSPEGLAVMDAYATIKTLVPSPDEARLTILLNMVNDAAGALEVHDRLQRACGRFLGIRAEHAGSVPYDAAAPTSTVSRQPLLSHSSNSPAAMALLEIVRSGRIARCPRDTETGATTTAAAGRASEKCETQSAVTIQQGNTALENILNSPLG